MQDGTHQQIKRKQALSHRFREILSRARSASKPRRPTAKSNASCISVASYNVHKCVGSDGVFDPKRVADVLLELDADIVALQEADMRFGTRAGVLDLKKLHDVSGYRALPSIGSKAASHGWHGNVILYREGVVGKVSRLDLPGLEPRGAVVVDLALAKGSLRVIAAHLGLLRRSRTKQVSMIVEAAQPADGHPVIVLGDMNEWRLGKRSALTMFDPHFGPMDRQVASFPAAFPLWSLDRILVSPNITVHDLEAHASPLAQLASDHLPVKAIIEINAVKAANVSMSAALHT
jgi:endonuclease/exonuclease/phosphatase family metal-dependent hydrolase